MSRSTLPAPSGLPLSPDQLAVLRAMLEQQRAFRVDQLAQLQRPEPGSPLGTTDPEIFDTLVSGARIALHDVQAALWRMDEGRYGQCLRCAAPIGVERLEILPQAAFCLACQRDAA